MVEWLSSSWTRTTDVALETRATSLWLVKKIKTNNLPVAHWYDADTLTASPSQINFLIFLSLFSVVSLVYLELTPRFAARGK